MMEGKSCLVTGGASGIGALCVEAFLKEGAKFAAILDVAEEKGQVLEEKLNKIYPGKVLFVKCDVGNEDSITMAFDTVVEKVKQLDVVVNNAGILNDSENFWRFSCEINLFVAILDADEEKGKALERKLTKEYPGKVAFVECNFNNEDSITTAFKTVVDKVYRIHVLVSNALNDGETLLRTSTDVTITMMAAISLNLKAVQHMRRDRSGAGGTIINVVSRAALGLTASKFPKPCYRAADATIVHFSRAISEEYSRVGLRVMMICFGLTHSPALQSVLVPVDPSIAKSLKANVGTTHCQRPESAAAAYVTVFKNGANGSVWISKEDYPAEDITESTIQRYY